MNEVKLNQRDIYKLVQNLTSGKFTSEIELLQSLVRDIVEHHGFEIIGGRVWELNPATEAYVLRYQYGSVEKIPDDYTIPVSEQPLFAKLHKQKTYITYETDKMLLAKGIEFYSATGVGDLLKLNSGYYYKYALGFNAPQILQTFFETLTIISSVASIAISDLHTKFEHQKFQHDLKLASEIQRDLLPEHFLEFHDYKIFGVCIPDNAIGGDYFDYLKSPDLEDERLGVVIGDAASKGLPAAIQALFVTGAMRMGISFSTKMSPLLSRLNTLIFDTFLFARFVTLFYCELTLSSNRLVLYANAGHCAPIHYSPSNDKIQFLDSTAGLLGIMQKQKIGIENITMKPGDILLLYTDGITEARDFSENFYGDERLCEILKQNKSETPKDIAYKILEDVNQFSAGGSYTDDKTLVVIKRDVEVD